LDVSVGEEGEIEGFRGGLRFGGGRCVGDGVRDAVIPERNLRERGDCAGGGQSF
jgi:hypothetical protein